MMKKVEKAGIEGMKMKRKPFRIEPDDFFHETDILRQLYSNLIDNPEPNRIVVIPSVSYGLANVANNLPFKEGEIIVCDEQFPSNMYPWMRLEEQGFKLTVVESSDSKKRGESWNEKILSAINEKTRLVSIGHIHWSDGSLFQLEPIRKKLDDYGGLLVVDGTQSIGALPFSVAKIRPDALICAGYKWLMGPYSIGMAYYGKAFDQGIPIEENWINRLNSNDFARLVNYQSEYREQSLRYEVGEHSNFILVPMLRQAIKQLLKWQPKNIQSYVRYLMRDAIIEMRELGLNIEEDNYRSDHLFGVRLPKSIDLEMMKNTFKRNRISVSFRGNSIRISPNVYNDELDVKKLVKVIKQSIFEPAI